MVGEALRTLRRQQHLLVHGRVCGGVHLGAVAAAAAAAATTTTTTQRDIAAVLSHAPHTVQHVRNAALFHGTGAGRARSALRAKRHWRARPGLGRTLAQLGHDGGEVLLSLPQQSVSGSQLGGVQVVHGGVQLGHHAAELGGQLVEVGRRSLASVRRRRRAAGEKNQRQQHDHDAGHLFYGVQHILVGIAF